MTAEAVLLATLLDRARPPLEVLRALLGHYGVDWLGWPYSVLKKTLCEELVADVPEWALHRAMAAGAVALQDAFWESWEHFHFLTQALNGAAADPQTHQELSVGQMMLAVQSANGVRKELGHLSYLPPFSEEVARYVAAQALNNGVWYLPSPLDFAARFATGRRYRCRDCGSDAEVLFDDGLCDTCVHRFDASSLGAWEPDPQLLSKGLGRHVEVYDQRDAAPVARRVEEIQRHPGLALQENAVDFQAAKVAAALEYAHCQTGSA